MWTMWKGDEVQSIPDPKVLETNVFKTEIPPKCPNVHRRGAKGNVKLIWTLSKLKQIGLQCGFPCLALPLQFVVICLKTPCTCPTPFCPDTEKEQ